MSVFDNKKLSINLLRKILYTLFRQGISYAKRENRWVSLDNIQCFFDNNFTGSTDDNSPVIAARTFFHQIARFTPGPDGRDSFLGGKVVIGPGNIRQEHPVVKIIMKFQRINGSRFLGTDQSLGMGEHS